MANPADISALAAARRALRKGQPGVAIPLLKSAQAEDPSNAEVCELLGLAQAAMGNNSAAMKALENATELDPRRASAHYNYALLLSDDHKLEEAIEENQAALFLNPAYEAAIELSTVLRQRIRDKNNRSAEDFGVVSYHPDPVHDSPSQWARLECATCGAMSFITARTCSRCGSLLQEMPDIVPVE